MSGSNFISHVCSLFTFWYITLYKMQLKLNLLCPGPTPYWNMTSKGCFKITIRLKYD